VLRVNIRVLGCGIEQRPRRQEGVKRDPPGVSYRMRSEGKGFVRITGEVTVSALFSPYLSMLRDCKCLVRCQVSVCLSQFPWLKSGGTRASLGIPDHPVRSSKPLGKARIG